MKHPWVNIALLVVLVVLLLTGFFGLVSGSERSTWVLWLHAAAGYTLVVMLFWKARVIVDVLRRRPRVTPGRMAFLALTALTVLILATGLVWTTAGPLYVSGFSLMTIHAVLALLVFALVAWHAVARRWVVRVRTARDRRAFLRLAGLALAGAALWQVGRSAKSALALPAAARRFTGSYETGSLTGAFPVVSWLFDFPAPLQVDGWRLTIGGHVDRPAVLSYAQFREFPTDSLTAILDCTGGWYSTQEWQGVKLGRLLAMAGVKDGAASITVAGSSGYGRRYPVAEAAEFILATHVGGRALEHGHGHPVRLVAPGRRGYDWVKWVTRIEVNDTSHLLAPPLPLQ